MKIFIQKLISNATTVESRIGLIAGILGSLFLFVIVAHWNIENRGFVYIQDDSFYEKGVEPELKEGITWQENEQQYEIVSQECLKKIQPEKKITEHSSEYDIQLTYDQCVTKVIPKKKVSKFRIRSSFPDFITSFFRSRWRGYAPYSWIMLLLFASSFLLYKNFASKAFSWVRTGKL